MFYIEMLVEIFVIEPVEVSHQYIHQPVGGSTHSIGVDPVRLPGKEFVGYGQNDVFYVVERRSLIWPAVDALARKESIAQIVPGSVEPGQVEVENKYEVVFIGTEVVDITAVYGKYLPGSHCYALMAGHDIDASVQTAYQLQCAIMVVGRGAGYVVNCGLAGNIFFVFYDFFVYFHDFII